jgi:FkbM family methyltransferase
MALSGDEIERLALAWPRLRRSIEVYYGDQARDDAMDALYRRFLKPGALAFDIGSHVGDRIGAFRRAGARVVALEPQPDCAAAIRAIYHGDAAMALHESACGPKAGVLSLQINSANPTVSTASSAFVEAASGASGWEGQVWDSAIEVPVTTLDALIEAHGRPDFIKIDVEGFEADVLAGLSQPIPALSFEFTTIQRDVVLACITRARDLGMTHFNLALGESQILVFAAPIDASAMQAYVLGLPHSANSGDIYAFEA